MGFTKILEYKKYEKGELQIWTFLLELED
jgi:hypothetical protein